MVGIQNHWDHNYGYGPNPLKSRLNLRTVLNMKSYVHTEQARLVRFQKQSSFQIPFEDRPYLDLVKSSIVQISDLTEKRTNSGEVEPKILPRQKCDPCRAEPVERAFAEKPGKYDKFSIWFKI